MIRKDADRLFRHFGLDPALYVPMPRQASPEPARREPEPARKAPAAR